MRFELPTPVRRLTRHRSTRLTTEGGQFLLFTLAIGVAAINTGNNLFYLLLAMMLSLILVSGIVAEYCLRRLEFSRHLPDLLFANEPATATLVVKNRKARLPSFSLQIVDVHSGHDGEPRMEIPQLAPQASTLLSYPLLAKRRGQWRLDGVQVATAFPFGLFVKKAFYPVEASIIVCPQIAPLADTRLQQLLTTGRELTLNRRGYGSDLYNLRLYQTGDDSRSIHWPTTARTSQLIVRETEAEDQRRATILLSTLAPSSHDFVFEQAVSFTASLVHHLADRGYVLRLGIGPSRSSHGQGEGHLTELLQMLALCERASPGSEAGAGAESPVESHDAEDGTTILVQPWSEVGHNPVESFVLFVNGAKVVDTAYAI